MTRFPANFIDVVQKLVEELIPGAYVWLEETDIWDYPILHLKFPGCFKTLELDKSWTTQETGSKIRAVIDEYIFETNALKEEFMSSVYQYDN
jgi:hypothetical protein